MQSVPEFVPEDLEARKVRTSTVGVIHALDLAEEYLLGAGNGAGPSGVDAAVEQVRHAVQTLTRLQEQLEALQWDMESAEMDAELLRRGYRQTAPGRWTSPAGENALTQLAALSRLDEEPDEREEAAS